MASGLYIHIPFCMAKCHYCNFNSFPLNNSHELDTYLRYLNQEIDLTLAGSVDTVFLGGGTPSLCSPLQISELLNTVAKKVCIEKNAEISIEINPGTISREKLLAYKSMGINRLSIGVQSMNDKFLKMLGRCHSSSDVISVVDHVKNIGFDNFSCDLIYGLPEQSIKDFEKDMGDVIGLDPEHISLYGLSVEKNTVLSHMITENILQEPDEDTAADMYLEARSILEKSGFYQYEISNYAKKNFACRHNLKYWSYQDYFGVGLGAHSFVAAKRYWNTDKLYLYYKYLSDREKPLENHEILDQEKQIKEFFMVALRRTQGISHEELNILFGNNWKQVLDKLINNRALDGLLIHDNEHIRLTNRGMILSNVVFRELV